MLQTKTIEPRTLSLLKELMSKDYLGRHYLVGGTALALKFGHRLSVDLDLFSHVPFEGRSLAENLERDFEEVNISAIRERGLNLNLSGVKTDILYYPYPPVFSVDSVDGVRFADVRDIAAMKLDAASRRSTKKDFYDIVKLLEFFSLSEMLEFHRAKYNRDTAFFLLRTMTYFDPANEDADPVDLTGTTWEEVKHRISEAVKLIDFQ